MVSSHNKNGSECIDKNGKVVFKANYEQINDYFDEGYAVVCKKGKAGMIDKKGRELIKPKYNSIYMFSEGLAAVQANGKWGYIDQNGKEVIKPQYDHGGTFSSGMAAVRKGDQWSFIDQNGKVVLE